MANFMIFLFFINLLLMGLGATMTLLTYLMIGPFTAK